MGITKGKGKVGEAMDKAIGAQNLANNLAKEAEAAVEPTTGSKRGRKPSTRMTLAKWGDIVESGDFTGHSVTIKNSGINPETKRFEFGSVTLDGAIVQYGEDGSLSMVTLSTDSRNKPIAIPGKTRSAAEVLAFLMDSK